jgi:hypothetical protein
MMYDADPGKQHRAFTFIKTPSVWQRASLRKLDPDLFGSVTARQHFDDEPKSLVSKTPVTLSDFANSYI